jgi:hypothetical protein
MFLQLPFASKELPDGKKLYRRKHGYTVALAANTVTIYEITVPYASQKINEAEIIGCLPGIKANFKVVDTASGTYSTIPNFVLDQFGFNVNITKDYFQDISQYDAHCYTGMRLVFEFDNPNAEHVIGINIVYHEVK